MGETIQGLIGSGFQDLLDWSKSILWIVVPIAITIFGIMFVWLFAKRFFMRIVGHKEKKEKDLSYDDEEDDEDEDY